MANDKKKPNVLYAFATQDTVKSRTMFSAMLSVKNVNFDYDVTLRMGCDIVGSRVWLAKEAKKKNFTHILYIDHDMFFPPVRPKFESPVSRMLAWDKDIIGAPYNFRQFPLKSTAKPLDKDLKIEEQTAPFKCSSLGTGFLLIKLSVFDKIPEPWFQFGRDKEGELVYGEDTWFCWEAQKAGFDVWADPTLGVKHIGDYLF